jgi:hypothetical protein
MENQKTNNLFITPSYILIIMLNFNLTVINNFNIRIVNKLLRVCETNSKY